MLPRHEDVDGQQCKGVVGKSRTKDTMTLQPHEGHMFGLD